jgi:Helix-turn-helix domain
MSFTHKHAVENTEFPKGKRADGRVISQSSIKAVLIALASHANDGEPNPKLKNLAWPSNETLAEESKCSVSTVKRVLAWARHLGFFKGVINRQKSGQTTRYLFRDVIEVDGKEMFSRGGSRDLPGGESQELPWEVPRELVGSSLGHKEVVPQAPPLPRPPGASSGSLGATNTINKTSTEGFQLKAVREAYKAELAPEKETEPRK